ncbi:MAG: hypothetical protein ACXWL2_03130 [Candidatus Chromulinivorax sp.]
MNKFQIKNIILLIGVLFDQSVFAMLHRPLINSRIEDLKKKNPEIYFKNNKELKIPKLQCEFDEKLIRLAERHEENENKEETISFVVFNGKKQEIIKCGPQSDKKRYSTVIHSLQNSSKISPEDIELYWKQARKIDSLPNITQFSEDFENEINQSSNKESTQIIYKNFSEQYKQRKAYLETVIKDFHQNNYPEIIKELNGILDSSLINSCKELYDKTCENYNQSSSDIGDYYNHAKSISLLQYLKERFTKHIFIQKYCLGYSQKIDIDNRKFNLDQIIFKNNNEMSCDTIASYRPYYKSININRNKFYKLSPSEQALTLMHELEHATQDSKLNSVEAEKEAELRSVKECDCKMCLQVVAALKVDNRRYQNMGYFGPKDYQYYADQSQKLCKAHGSCDLTPLKKAIKDKKESEIIKLDNRMGNIFERLPSLEIPELD